MTPPYVAALEMPCYRPRCRRDASVSRSSTRRRNVSISPGSPPATGPCGRAPPMPAPAAASSAPCAGRTWSASTTTRPDGGSRSSTATTTRPARSSRRRKAGVRRALLRETLRAIASLQNRGLQVRVLSPLLASQASARLAAPGRYGASGMNGASRVGPPRGRPSGRRHGLPEGHPSFVVSRRRRT